MQLTRLVYVSNHGGITENTLEHILAQSRHNNARDGLSGLLIVGEEDFLQWLEGGKTAVAQCFMRIMQDVRHRHIHVLLAGPIETRLCGQSSMQLAETSKLDGDLAARHDIGGAFDPDALSEETIEALCRDVLSASRL